MKKFIIIFLALFLFSGHAGAHIAGLPVADGAVPLGQDMKRVSGGFVLGDGIDLFGGRFAYGMDNRLTIFGDFGFTDPDYGDTGWGVQGGGLYALSITDIPFDMAARGTLEYATLDTRTESIDIFTANIGAVGSKDFDMLTPYGYFGLNYSRASNGGSDSELSPALGGGVLFHLNPQFSLYAELMHIDDPWGGFGFRYAF